jgi:hypothetical protein
MDKLQKKLTRLLTQNTKLKESLANMGIELDNASAFGGTTNYGGDVYASKDVLNLDLPSGSRGSARGEFSPRKKS